MLEVAPKQKQENHATFSARLQVFSPPDRLRLEQGYIDAKEAFRYRPPRESGERYFEHVREVFLILYDKAHVRDTDILLAALHHDTAEDTSFFGIQDGLPYSIWRNVLTDNVSAMIGERAASMVVPLTRPEIDNIEIFDKHQKMQIYIQNLEAAPPETILVKMADRLHNLRTLHFRRPEKQLEVIEETKTEYMPLFRHAAEVLPEEGGYLFREIEAFLSNQLNYPN